MLEQRLDEMQKQKDREQAVSPELVFMAGRSGFQMSCGGAVVARWTWSSLISKLTFLFPSNLHRVKFVR